MSMKNLYNAFKILEDNPSLIRGMKGNIAPALIQRAQQYLGVNFSLTYKEFLKKFGYIRFEGREIYGVLKEDFIDSGIPDAIWLSHEDHKIFGWPNFLIHIYDVGEGTAYCLDTSQMSKEGECPVVAWPVGGYEETPVLEVVAEDFGKFFLDKVKEQVEYKRDKNT